MPQLTVVHREPLSIEYLAPSISSSNFWRLFTITAIALCTLLLTFATQGLWRRTNTYLEQPIVDFRDRILFIFYDQNGSVDHFWTPFQEINAKWADRLLMPAMEMSLRDFDGDWRPDEIFIRTIFRQTNGADFLVSNISSIFYAIFFDIRLERRAWVELESCPIFGQSQLLSPSLNELNVFAHLNFIQMEPLPWYGNLSVPEWNPQAADNSSQQSVDANLEELVWQLRQNYVGLNYMLDIGRNAEHWRRLPPSNDTQQNAESFHFAFRGRIHEQILHYRTNGWEMLKWAWIQFLSIFFIVRAVFGWLSSFLYQNQILGTVEAEQRRNDEWEGKKAE